MYFSPCLPLAAVGLLPLALPATAYADERVPVGQVFIIGNTETPRWVIEPLVAIRTGDKVSATDLQRAEARLRRVGLFRRDPRAGMTPAVRLLPAEEAGAPRDLAVYVEEGEWNWLLYGCAELAVGWRTGDPGWLNAGALRLRDGIRGRRVVQ